MFAVKIFNKINDRNIEFNDTISNLIKYLSGDLNRSAKVISDNECVELISGQEIAEKKDGIVTELLIKKTLFINNNDLKDRNKLDKYISEIRSFCDNADKIEDVHCVPFSIRIHKEKKDE